MALRSFRTRDQLWEPGQGIGEIDTIDTLSCMIATPAHE